MAVEKTQRARRIAALEGGVCFAKNARLVGKVERRSSDTVVVLP